MRTATSCPDCEELLEHCHGVLLRHVDGVVVCTGDGDCRGVLVQHEHVVDCSALAHPCGCDDRGG